ncbi:nucleoside-diphosphate sugar epimerase/dehydratase [Halomonas cibimaris]|uniref:Nucleoside-diphosphate sugar epimerase/dehydratase n=1 Tax=Halomonas cibimaris TaxID=657012 RepID=A0ABP7LDM3_9GAMM
MIRLLQPLFSLPRRAKRLIQLTADVALITLSFLLAMLLRLDSSDFLSQPGVWLVLPVMIPVSLLIFMRLGFYRAVIRYMSVKAFKTIMLGVLGSALTLAVVNYLYQLPVPRSVPFIYALLAMFTIGGVRFGLRAIYMRGQLRYKTRVLIYGAGSSGRQLTLTLRHGNEYEPIAFIDDSPGLHRALVMGMTVYAAQDIERLIANYGIDKVLLAIPSATRQRRREVLERLEPLAVPVQTIPGMADMVSGQAKVSEMRDVAVEDLLGRDPVPPTPALMRANIYDKVVMVTGAGGSIGAELCRQILRQSPRRLLLLEVSEYGLYQIEQDLKWIADHEGYTAVHVHALLGSVQHRSRIETILRTYQVQSLYHAAAYKHVPLVEHNMVEGLRNNVMGTLETAQAAVAAEVESFVLVSTDKAVRPTNVMGASKRLAELVCQALASRQAGTRFSMVRFGNVLGSSGSVVPLFRRQIAAGGPVTVTHPDITRYFMTIPEAAQLVIQAGAMGQGGDVFVLDMGEPVRIAGLAERMIRLTGLEPVLPAEHEQAPDAAENVHIGDIAIRYTGLRPGEKLYEELLIGDNVSATRHERIMTAHESALTWPELEELVHRLFTACRHFDYGEIRQLLINAPLDYQPSSALCDLLSHAPAAPQPVTH